MIQGHGKTEELTTMHMEGSAASGESPRRRVTIGGGDWKEREGAGEDEIEENKTKTEKGRHLRSRGTTAKLWESSATWIEAR